MIDFSTPLAGITNAEASLDKTAQRLARVSEPGGDVVDLSAEMIALLQARNAVKINASVLRTQEDVSNQLVNLLG